jgi:hypothetical protein
MCTNARGGNKSPATTAALSLDSYQIDGELLLSGDATTAWILGEPVEIEP